MSFDKLIYNDIVTGKVKQINPLNKIHINKYEIYSLMNCSNMCPGDFL